MSSGAAGRRRSAPLVIWLGLGVFALVAAASAGLGLLAWQEAEQVRAFQDELVNLRAERQAVETHLLALQGTATAMEERLAALEANDPGQQLMALQGTAAAMEERLAASEANDPGQELMALQAAVDSANDTRQLDNLQDSLTGIQTTVNGFQSTLDSLSARVHALERENNLPPEVRLTVARQRQSHNLSCESSAASMVANYHGSGLSEADVLADLPLDDNPHLGFRGDVDGPTGGIEDYGVYSGPILKVLRDHGLRAWSIEDGLRGIKAALARGNPVIAWVTYNCQPSTPTTVTIQGEKVTLVPWQHVVVVTGYNQEGVWANDPLDGKEDFYGNDDFERAMGYFDGMAIEVAAP